MQNGPVPMGRSVFRTVIPNATVIPSLRGIVMRDHSPHPSATRECGPRFLVPRNDIGCGTTRAIGMTYFTLTQPCERNPAIGMRNALLPMQPQQPGIGRFPSNFPVMWQRLERPVAPADGPGGVAPAMQMGYCCKTAFSSVCRACSRGAVLYRTRRGIRHL
jgi:hypothetical protein